MKILELNFWLAPGGAERFMVDLSNELARKHEVEVVTLKDDCVNPEYRSFYKMDLNPNVKYINLGMPDKFSIRSQFAIYNVIKKEKPDIVHIQAETILKFSLLAIFLLHNKVAFFETVHNDLHNGYDRGMFKYIANTFGRLKKIRYVALSKTNYESMTNFYPRCMFEHIDNGRSPISPTKFFESVKEEINLFKVTERTKVFLHVARFSKQKNQQLLVDSFNELVEKGNDVALVVIGAHFDEPGGVVLKQKACSRIHFLGTKKNISDYMLNVDAFVLSSIFEGMPITLIEASLAGIPIVSTPVCGAVDIVKSGENGVLSKDFSKECFIASIEELLECYDSIKKKSLSMSQSSPYAIAECAQKYERFFSKAL